MRLTRLTPFPATMLWPSGAQWRPLGRRVGAGLRPAPTRLGSTFSLVPTVHDGDLLPGQSIQFVHQRVDPPKITHIGTVLSRDVQ